MRTEAIGRRRRASCKRTSWLLLLALAASCAQEPVGATMQGGGSGTAALHAGAGATSGGATGAGAGATNPGVSGTAGAAGAGAAGGGAVLVDAAVFGTQDAGGAEGSESASCAGESFCDSFDATQGPQLDGARWQVVTPNCSGDAEVAVDGDVAHSGAQSVRVRGGAGYCNHVFIRPTALAPPLPDPLYARFFLRLHTPLTSAHVTFLALHDAAEAKDLRMGGQSEILMWNRESDDATLPELSPTGIAASVRPTAETWICIEFMIDAAGQTLRTWVDGQPVSGLEVEGDATPDIDAQWRRKADWQPQLQDVKLGWESYGDGANTLWFDDVAIGETRFGCTP